MFGSCAEQEDDVALASPGSPSGRACSPATRAGAAGPRREHVGRFAWKSKNSSGSISANCSASHCRARKPAASDAPWPPSFQPRNAATSTGRSSDGFAVIRSSSSSGQSSAVSTHRDRAPEHGDEPDRPAQDRRGHRDVHEHEPPRQPVPVLRLADRHLDADEDERPAQPGTSHALAAAPAGHAERRARKTMPKAAVARTCDVDRRLELAEAARPASRPGAGPPRSRACRVTTSAARRPATTARAAERARGTAGGRRPRSARVASSSTSTPPASTASASRKCVITRHGLRS